MKHRNNTYIRGGLFVALLSCTSLMSASQAAAFGVNVINPTLLAQAKNFVSNGQNQVVELNQIKNLEQQQLDAMGQAGPLGSLISGGGMDSVGSQSDFYQNMQKFSFDPCAVNLCQTGDNPIGTTDIEEARDWAMTNFFAGELLEPEFERDLHEIRRRGAINAAVDGMAIATITHNELAGAGEQADALDQVVAASIDLRGDIRANSAIALASYKIQIQQLAMLTSLVEIQAMDNINNATLYHESGGSEFADAYLDEDFSAQDSSHRLSVTPPDQGSASGSGLGGALLSSISGNSSVSDVLSGAGLVDPGTLPTDISTLADSIGSGALPSVQPDDMTMSAVVSDTASVARTALEASPGTESLQGAMSLVQGGLSDRSAQGNAKAMMGIAQSLATTGGNDMLSAALTTGTLALESNNADSSIAFARGVLRDISSNGITGTYVEHLESSISNVENGSQSSETLVLDSAAILASLGSDTNRKASDILQVDPAGATEEFFQQSLSEALTEAATFTGNTNLSGIAQSLSSVNQGHIDQLRETMITHTARNTAAD